MDPNLRPYCNYCGWRKGGPDSWDGAACKCGLTEPPIQPLTRAEYGRGFDRMKARMGAKGYAQNIAQVLADQAAALSDVGKHDVKQRDRDSYKSYPPTKRK